MAKTTALQAWNIAANEWQTIDTEAGASDVTDWELADRRPPSCSGRVGAFRHALNPRAACTHGSPRHADR